MEVEGFASSCAYAHGNHVLVPQNDSRLGPEDFHSHDTIEVATSPETDKYCSQMSPASCIEGGPELFGKRIGDVWSSKNSFTPSPADTLRVAR